MEITEEQKRRAEANRLAALEKRKRLAAGPTEDAWRLSKCSRIPITVPEAERKLEPPRPPVRFCVVLEICSPDEFSVTPKPLQGSQFPGVVECLRNIEACLLPVMPYRAIESQGGRRASVYKLKDYELVSRCIKKLPGVELQDIPFTTRMVVQKFSHCIGDRWAPDPSLPRFYSDEKVDEYLERLPKLLRDALLPFQLEGVRFALRRGGRCLIADEMGLGKTIQAIAIASCFMDQGPILVVCPAVLRFSWAEELEHWLPFLLPRDIHLVFGHQNNLDRLERSPKVVVTSYNMLNHLWKSMLEREWALIIVDESHKIRCTKKKSESKETKAVLEVASKAAHIILLSGTPSLSRPYDIYHQIDLLWPHLLGKDKYEFAKVYCSMRLAQVCHGTFYKDFSKGIRLEELNVLLRQTLMIRRLKEHVLAQLPPKRRQIIRLKLKAADILLATTSCRVHDRVCMNMKHQNEFEMKHCINQIDAGGDKKLEIVTPCRENDSRKRSRHLSHQEIGIAKLSGFREWFSSLAIIRESEDASSLDKGSDSQKMIIFSHHLKVLDGIQEFICEKGIQFVRIDGSTLARDRQAAVEAFRLSTEVKIAIIGITAGGVGLDFSSAQNVVFLELPRSASEMLQAEDRAHRRGQTNAVNIYIFCAKDTLDESHWLHLNKSLFRVSSMMNGDVGAIKEIEVEKVFYLDYTGNSSHNASPEGISTDDLNNGSSAKCRMQVIKVHSDKNEECEGSASEHNDADKIYPIQTDPLQFEADKLLNSDMKGGSAVYGNVKQADPEYMHIGQSGTGSGLTLDKGNVQYDSLENIAQKVDKGHDVLPIYGEDGAEEQIEAYENTNNQAESLRFEGSSEEGIRQIGYREVLSYLWHKQDISEPNTNIDQSIHVSQYTKRIHLYICIRGKDSRPRPLFENFRPEELSSIIPSAGDIKEGTSLQILKENPDYYNIFQNFIKQWNALRPIQQNKLLGKPLQLPLSLELCYMKETIKHGCEGLLKGGSKRRVAPLSDISRPVPENAIWRKVALSGGPAKEKEYTQAWTVSDEPLCKLCQEPCNGKLAKSPEYFEDLFCNFSCFQEYRMRTSQRALREALFQIEHGVCAQCKLDCHKLVKCIRPLSIERRQEYIQKVAPKLASKKKLLGKLVHEPSEGNAWHADHIVAVSNGGGECGLENMRTLCVACHSEVTAAQRSKWRSERKRAKEMVKITRKEIEDGRHTENTADLIGRKEVVEVVEDSLFVTVPGSAYSRRCSLGDNQEHG